MVAQLLPKQWVAGSNPVSRSNHPAGISSRAFFCGACYPQRTLTVNTTMCVTPSGRIKASVTRHIPAIANLG